MAQQWIVQHGEAYVTEKLDYTSAQRSAGKIRGTVSGFVNAAITQDYRTETYMETRAIRAAKVRRDNADRQQADSDAALRADKLARLQAAKAAIIWFEGQGAEERASLMESFKASLDKGYLLADLSKFGLEAPLIAPRFSAFIESVKGS